MQFLSIIFLAFLFLFPLFHSGIPVSHDGDAHVARFAAYYQAFQDGHFPARWAGDLNFGFGTPIFIFYYPLPGYVASFLHAITTVSFENIFKFLLASSFVAAPFFFYLWAKLLFRREVALLGALLYGLAPYHFLNLYVRGDIAELVAFVFVPLVFWAIEKVSKGSKFVYSVLGGIFYGLLILSHNGVSLMFSPVLLLYGIVQSRDKQTFLRILTIFILGLSLAAFFWIPALYEGKYVNAHLFIGSMFQYHFPTVVQLISSPWGFGADVAKPGGLSPQIGLLYLTFVIGACVLFVTNKIERKVVWVWLFVFFAAVFITLPISTIIWNNVPILRLYEFPWRFVGLASFAAVVLATYVINEIKDKKSLIVIGIVLLVTSIPFVQVKEYVKNDDAFYISFTGTTYFHGEASPIWTAGDPGNFAKSQIEIIGGEGDVQQMTRKNHEHSFTLDAKNTVKILDNTIYYPGWKVFVDGREIPIQFQDPNHRGLITFEVPQGKHTIQVSFQETKVRLLADFVSLIALGFVVVFFVKTLLYNKKVRHV